MKIIVCCPGDQVTGGPELLHQFVSCLSAIGADAYIMYYPFVRDYATPPVYMHYGARVMRYSEYKPHSHVVVLPERGTHLIRRLHPKKVFIWWLSVDNYFGGLLPSTFRQWASHYRYVLKGERLPFTFLKRYSHLAQSYYASEFLQKSGIRSDYLTDYLNDVHLGEVVSGSHKSKVILYNPKKGFLTTSALIKQNPDLTFRPIENMTPEQVSALLASSQIYIDFGHHPGKDRFPREAAMAGCCIITGRRGSAANSVDIPIPNEYKLNEMSPHFQRDFRALVDSIFDDFDHHDRQMIGYRESIRREPATFRQQVGDFLGSLA